jgi:HEPN domain-containing protein
MMDIEKQVAYWRAGAEEAWDGACYMIEGGRFNLGLFMAHLALEKALKAHVCRVTQQLAPKIHNLLQLREMSGLSMTARQLDVLGKMNFFQIEGRYPGTGPSSPSRLMAESLMASCKDMFTWLIQELLKA